MRLRTMATVSLEKLGEDLRSQKRKILIIMMDGFDPAYLQASDMPNTKQRIAQGFYKTVKGVMPSVTNVNITGICCGVPPSIHGITADSYFRSPK